MAESSSRRAPNDLLNGGGTAGEPAFQWQRPPIAESAEAADAAIDAAIDFLRRFHPATPWALSSFGPGDNEIGPAQTFDPSEEDVARRFIRGLQGRHNVYFSVNHVSRKLTKKASKADITEIHWLHVDADLSKTLDWSDADAMAAEKHRVLEMLHGYKAAPTAIVWSGGGYQAFWRLSEVLVVNGNENLMAPIERRMQRIAKAFGADACHNADRIMRVAGTLNVLCRTKIRAGRQPALAELVEFYEDRIYNLEDFPEPEAPHNSKCGGSNGQGSRHRADYEVDEYKRARDALRVIPADDYDIYVRIGMALMSAFGDAGFGLYRDWAMSSIKFNDDNLRKKWESIKPEGGVTIATLFGMARDRGWRDERKNGPRSSEGVGTEKPAKEAKAKGASQATVLADIAMGDGVELFRTPEGDAYADIYTDGHRETWPVRSRGFKWHLRGAYYKQTGVAAGNDATSAALEIVEAQAQFGGAVRQVHLRVAEHDGRIYVNLADPKWRAVEIASGAWRVVEEPPVRFARKYGMLELPEPVRGGSIAMLREHLRVLNEGFSLVAAWLLAALRPRGPYPVLALTGEQGTAKSTTLRMLKCLVDPNAAPLRAPPDSVKDLYVAAINGHVITFDNVSYLSGDVSDAMCRLSTGGGFSTRALYTDDEEKLFDGQRPQGLNGIGAVVSRPDLLERTLGVQLETIPDDARKLEDDLWAAFNAARPGILGALYDAVAHGLKLLPDVRPNRLPRMADFARWSIACETAYQKPGTFMMAYGGYIDEAAHIALESDILAQAPMDYMRHQRRGEDGYRRVETTSGDLLGILTASVGEQNSRNKLWPKSPEGMAAKLARLAPVLRKIGITIERAKKREPGTGRRPVIITDKRGNV